MPRKTHPRPVRKHSREHTRVQRERFIERRYKKAVNEHVNVAAPTGMMILSLSDKSHFSRHLNDKDRAAAWAQLQELMDRTGQAGPNIYIHPEEDRKLPDELARALSGRVLPSSWKSTNVLSNRLAPWSFHCCIYCTPALDGNERARQKRIAENLIKEGFEEHCQQRLQNDEKP